MKTMNAFVEMIDFSEMEFLPALRFVLFLSFPFLPLNLWLLWAFASAFVSWKEN